MCQGLLEVGKMHFCFIFQMFVFRSVHSSHFSHHFLFHFSDHSDHFSAKHPKMIQKISQKSAKNGPKMTTVNNPNESGDHTTHEQVFLGHSGTTLNHDPNNFIRKNPIL
jgi:hypothetical protein